MSPNSKPHLKSTLGREEELQLHRRLLAGDHTATADLAIAFYEHLVTWLSRRNRGRAENVCGDAANEAIYSLMKCPAAYKPDHKNAKGLFAYLKMSAQGDLMNLLKVENRHHFLRKSWESVEHSKQGRNKMGHQDDPSLALQIAEAAATSDHVLSDVRDGLTEIETRVLDLMRTGERKTTAYANVCGVSDLPLKQQRIEVKRVKGKLKQRMKRARASK